jgi:hypothetical protein
VQRFCIEDGRVYGVVLDDGTQLEGRNVLSSAGWFETMRLCDAPPPANGRGPGRMSFVETVSVLDAQPQQLGHRDTIVFFNDSPTFDWQVCEDLCDVRTGVICSPNNFLYEDSDLGGRGSRRAGAADSTSARQEPRPPNAQLAEGRGDARDRDRQSRSLVEAWRR